LKKRLIVSVVAMLLVVIAGSKGYAEVEAEFQRTLRLKETPVDLAVSQNGKWIFVLTQSGSIQIYTPDGRMEGQIAAGRKVDGIRVGPREDLLLLTSKEEKTVQIVVLDFIRHINVSGSPFKGPADAPVVIAVFSDFECVYCRRLVPLLEQVLEKNSGKVKLVFKNFPLQSHKNARKAAAAALAADRQGKFWPFHDRLFGSADKLSDEKILEIAGSLGLNMEVFKSDLKNPAIQAKIQQDFQDGIQAGVRGTPAVYINGRMLKNRTLAGFQEIIDKELGKISGGK